jgi:hypothetical protein
MDNLNALIPLAEKNLGAFAVLAILLLIRYQDRREVRQSEESQRDDAKEQALIEVLGGFVQNFAQMVEGFAGTLSDQSEALRAITGSIDHHEESLDGARHDLQTLLTGQMQLQEGVDRLPERVSARLVDDFKEQSAPEKRVRS